MRLVLHLTYGWTLQATPAAELKRLIGTIAYCTYAPQTRTIPHCLSLAEAPVTGVGTVRLFG